VNSLVDMKANIVTSGWSTIIGIMFDFTSAEELCEISTSEIA
jgi:hypothetical protein